MKANSDDTIRREDSRIGHPLQTRRGSRYYRLVFHFLAFFIYDLIELMELATIVHFDTAL